MTGDLDPLTQQAASAVAGTTGERRARAQELLDLAGALRDKQEATPPGPDRDHIAARRRQLLLLSIQLSQGADPSQIPALLRAQEPALVPGVIEPQHLTANLEEAIRRSLKLLPHEFHDQVSSVLLSEGALATTAGILAAWAAAHAFGLGELIDLFLGLYGVATLGWDMVRGVRLLWGFYSHCVPPAPSASLDIAAQDFAAAVVLLGFDAVASLLLHEAVNLGHGRPQPAEADEAQVPGRGAVGVGPSSTSGRLWLVAGLGAAGLAMYLWQRHRRTSKSLT